MRYLLDTGILLRLVNRDAPLHEEVRRSVRLLKSRGDVVIATYQNLAEFWNVSTRPVEARGGFGLTTEQTRLRLRVVERIVALLPESPTPIRTGSNSSLPTPSAASRCTMRSSSH